MTSLPLNQRYYHTKSIQQCSSYQQYLPQSTDLPFWIRPLLPSNVKRMHRCPSLVIPSISHQTYSHQKMFGCQERGLIHMSVSFNIFLRRSRSKRPRQQEQHGICTSMRYGTRSRSPLHHTLRT